MSVVVQLFSVNYNHLTAPNFSINNFFVFTAFKSKTLFLGLRSFFLQIKRMHYYSAKSSKIRQMTFSYISQEIEMRRNVYSGDPIRFENVLTSLKSFLLLHSQVQQFYDNSNFCVLYMYKYFRV